MFHYNYTYLQRVYLILCEAEPSTIQGSMSTLGPNSLRLTSYASHVQKKMKEASACMNYPLCREVWVLQWRARSQRGPPPNLPKRIAHASYVQKGHGRSLWVDEPSTMQGKVGDSTKSWIQRGPHPNLLKRIAHTSQVQNVMGKAYAWMNQSRKVWGLWWRARSQRKPPPNSPMWISHAS